MEFAHAHCSNWPAKLTALLTGSAENDPKTRLDTLERMPKHTLKKFQFYLDPV